MYAFGSRQTFIVANVYVARFPVNDPNASGHFGPAVDGAIT
jgi:hypothetical protein